MGSSGAEHDEPAGRPRRDAAGDGRRAEANGRRGAEQGSSQSAEPEGDRAPAGPPGTERYLDGRPRRSWELLVCGWRGHEVVGSDVAEIRHADSLVARQSADGAGIRWLRCLRCDAWLPLPDPEAPARAHLPEQAEIPVPLRGKGLRDKLVLRLIAIDRAFHFLLLSGLAIAIFALIGHRAQLRTDLYKVLADLQGGLLHSARSGHGFLHDLNLLLSLRTTKLELLGAAVLGYAVLEGVEAIGLWMQRRWAEYLTFVATVVLLPLEVYELAGRFSVLKLATFAINVAIVVYLIYAKRLFGVRGGGRADELARAEDQGWEALIRTAPAPATAAPRPHADPLGLRR